MNYPTHGEVLITQAALAKKDARIAELEAALQPFVQAYNENEYFITSIMTHDAWITAAKTLEGAE